MNYSPKFPSQEFRSHINADVAIASQLCHSAPAENASVGGSVIALPNDSKKAIDDNLYANPERQLADIQSVSSETFQHNPENLAKDNTAENPLTLNIAEHPQAELLTMLSSLLSRITFSNDNILTGSEPMSSLKPGSPLVAFHARNIPSISIQSYLTRILKYCPMSSDIFLSLLVYFDRMSNQGSDERKAQELSTFTSTRQLMGNEKHPLSIDSYNVHRLVITGIVVASKFCSDVFYTNSRYAKVGGLPLSELNHLEFQFLLMNDFRLMIPVEELQRYGDQLLNFWHNEASVRAKDG